MPWVLMSMFTLVQVIGNVYSSYKYIITNSVENLRYFKEPIFIWTELPDAQANVIIVYLVGALLPIAALLLTSMITNYLSDQEEEKLKELENIHSNELTQAQHLKESDEDKPKVEEPEVDAVIDKPKKKKSYSASYEKMREEINKEVEEYGDDTYTPFGFGDDNTSLIGTIINVFLWAAAAVAIVLFIYFIITREIVTAFLYVIGLIVAFFFGYGIMYFLDKFIIEK
jgi:VIT1/CCC1 family predicted Fe2+/Mn2+ transporter